MFKRFKLLFGITHSKIIARRYFVVNGFDGVLTMTGLLMGFYVNKEYVPLSIIVTACLGAAIALAVSGISSAYISESAEKKKELKELENAMIADLKESAHGQAARFMPLIVALVNGLSPLIFALIIMSPLWLAQYQPEVVPYAIETALAVAFIVIFCLGVYIGNINNNFWLWAGIRALLIALFTSAIIYLIGFI